MFSLLDGVPVEYQKRTGCGMNKQEVFTAFLNEALDQLGKKRLRAKSLEEVPYGIDVVGIPAKEGMIYEHPKYAEKLYEKLSRPKERYKVPPGLEEKVKFSDGAYGIPSSVSFQTKQYKQSDPSITRWDYSSPAENNRRGGDWTSDVTKRDMFKVFHDYKNFVNSPQGRGLRYNAPIGGLDGERAKLYRRVGFEDAAVGDNQILDTRRPITEAARNLLAMYDKTKIDSSRMTSAMASNPVPALVVEKGQRLPDSITPEEYTELVESFDPTSIRSFKGSRTAKRYKEVLGGQTTPVSRLTKEPDMDFGASEIAAEQSFSPQSLQDRLDTIIATAEEVVQRLRGGTPSITTSPSVSASPLSPAVEVSPAPRRAVAPPPRLADLDIDAIINDSSNSVIPSQTDNEWGEFLQEFGTSRTTPQAPVEIPPRWEPPVLRSETRPNRMFGGETTVNYVDAQLDADGNLVFPDGTVLTRNPQMRSPQWLQEYQAMGDFGEPMTRRRIFYSQIFDPSQFYYLGD